MFPPLHSHCSLAAITADDQGTLLLYIISGIIAFLAVVASVAKIYEAFFKTPKSKAHQPVTMAEFEGFCKLSQAKFKEIDLRFLDVDKDVRNLLQTLTSELRSIHRSIGRLDGILSAQHGVSTEQTGAGESPH
jgi:hypothetical protein